MEKIAFLIEHCGVTTLKVDKSEITLDSCRISAVARLMDLEKVRSNSVLVPLTL